MKKYSLEEFNAALDTVGISEGDTLLIHSSLLSLGILEGAPLREMPKFLFNALKERAGESGTIVVPTFTYVFCRGKAYDRQNSPSEKMGEFSEYVRKLPDSIRSKHPMESVAAHGKNAAYICEPDVRSSFSDNGPFDRLIELNAKLLLLGATFNASSVVHRAEVKLEVPYRYWKEFTGEYIDQGRAEVCTYSMYVRDLERNPRLNLKQAGTDLEEQGKVKKAKVGAGNITCLAVKDFYSHVYQRILENPYAMVGDFLP